jgi:hypothetical protein
VKAVGWNGDDPKFSVDFGHQELHDLQIKRAPSSASGNHRVVLLLECLGGGGIFCGHLDDLSCLRPSIIAF